LRYVLQSKERRTVAVQIPYQRIIHYCKEILIIFYRLLFMAQSRRTAGNFILLGHTIDFVIYILIIVFRIVLNECLNKKGWYFRGQNICIIV